MNRVDECSDLGRLARSEMTDLVLFGWMRAVQRVLPGVSEEKAIDLFIKDFKLQEEFSPDTARNTYQRMKRKLIDDERTTRK